MSENERCERDVNEHDADGDADAEDSLSTACVEVPTCSQDDELRKRSKRLQEKGKDEATGRDSEDKVRQRQKA